MSKYLIALMLVPSIAFAGELGAQTYFTRSDIPRIVDTSRGNEIRFNRDFKGRMFKDLLPFRRASERFMGGGYMISSGEGGFINALGIWVNRSLKMTCMC